MKKRIHIIWLYLFTLALTAIVSYPY